MYDMLCVYFFRDDLKLNIMSKRNKCQKDRYFIKSI